MTISLKDAQSRLAELVRGLKPDEEAVITDEDKPVAKIVGLANDARPLRQPGLLRDHIISIADDFDAPLEEFKDYM